MNKVARATASNLFVCCHLSDGHHEQVAPELGADCEWAFCADFAQNVSHIFNKLFVPAEPACLQV